METNPDLISTKARDRTCSGISHAIKLVREENVVFNVLKRLIGKYKLHLLVVWNNSYEKQGRPSNYGSHDKGKKEGVGFPTGGSEAKEATPHVAIREILAETGYQEKWTIRPMYEFTALKPIHGTNPKQYHPHYPFLVETETDLVHDIREKKEIKKAEWITFCEIIERLKLSDQAQIENRINPEAFYYSHARDYLIPHFLKVYYMQPEEIAAEKNKLYREWLMRYQPYIIEEIDEHASELINLRLMTVVKDEEEEIGTLPIENTEVAL